MKIFLDTSVLIATFYGDHEHHEASIRLFARHEKDDLFCGAHSLVETYAVLTGMPGQRKAAPHEAMLFLSDIRARVRPVALDETEYFVLTQSSSDQGLTGGSIYDALLGHCALKAGAKILFTWNTKDFLRLFPENPAWARRPDTV